MTHIILSELLGIALVCGLVLTMYGTWNLADYVTRRLNSIIWGLLVWAVLLGAVVGLGWIIK